MWWWCKRQTSKQEGPRLGWTVIQCYLKSLLCCTAVLTIEMMTEGLFTCNPKFFVLWKTFAPKVWQSILLSNHLRDPTNADQCKVCDRLQISGLWEDWWMTCLVVCDIAIVLHTICRLRSFLRWSIGQTLSSFGQRPNISDWFSNLASHLIC